MVGVIDSYIRYPLGSRIRIADNCGTVKYVGEVTGYDGTWLGIEWDDPKRGKHNGIVDGKRYFCTEHPTAGSFIRTGKLGPCESLEEAARNRYLGYNSTSLDQDLIRSAQEAMQASFFEVVGMEKIARKQSKFEQLTDISVDDCPVNSAGYLKDFSMLTTLNLSHTLIWNWEIVAEIVKQLPTLANLNLSCNRLLMPTETQIIDLEPAFRNLQHLNLRNCGYNNWQDIMHIARLWPNIISLGLQENAIATLKEVNCKEIFIKLRELDLHRTKIMDFDQICKLGNIKTLNSLNLMENGIEEIKLPDCEANVKLNIFLGLEQLNLLYNPIWNEANTFNELDKLPKLKKLEKTPHMKSDFNEMFSNAVGMISNIEKINKAYVTAEERRGAEYDIWKKYALEWLQASKTADTLNEFYKKHRSYAIIVKKYGSPADFVPLTTKKKSNLLKICILNKRTNEIWEKKVPRMLTVQTLQGLIVKHFGLEKDFNAQKLSYTNALHPDIIVSLENHTKTLDFYSVQDDDVILVE